MALSFVLALLALPPVLHAQGSQTGTLTGTITDTDGAVLPGVSVKVTSDALLGERTAWSGANGDFSLPGLPVGTYRVVYRLDGMQTVERIATVELGRTARSDATLPLGEIQESIEVLGETPAILETPQVGANFTYEEVDSLAIDRAILPIANLAPGVSDRDNFGQLSISGGLGYDNLVMVNGVDVTFGIWGNTAGPFQEDVGLYIEEAIEQTQVLTAAISAEYGHFSGGVINAITKQGGNQFRGSVRLDLTNPSWQDETPIEEDLRISRESKRNELVSATFGGRIVRDRLWFFAAASNTDRSDPFVLRFAGTQAPFDFENRRLEIKLTGNLNASHTLELVGLDNSSDIQGVVSEDFKNLIVDPRSLDDFSLEHGYLVGRYSGVLSRSLLLEARAHRRKFETVGLGGSSTDIRDSPHITFDFDIYNAPWFDEADPPENFEDEQLAASLSMFLPTASTGSHDLKFGLERLVNKQFGGKGESSTQYQFFVNFLTDASGTPIFDDQGRYQPLWDPLGAFPVNVLADRDATLETDTVTLYVNDNWRLNDKWSFNLGFRYEDVGADASSAGQVIGTSTLVPRLAATYAAGRQGRYRIRGSYAEYAGAYNRDVINKTSTSRNPTYIDYAYLGPPGLGMDFAPAYDANNWVPIGAFIPSANVFFEDGLSSPRSREISLSTAMDLGTSGFLEVAYIRRELTDIIESFTTLDNGKTLADTPAGPLLLDNVVFRNTDKSTRDYQAIQAQGRYRIRQNWTVDGSYTWQIENDGNFEGGSAFNPAEQSAVGDYPEILPVSRVEPTGRLGSYLEHKLRIWTNYGLDFGRGSQLDIGLLFRHDSGRPYSLTAFAPVSPQQLANDPGYATPPATQTLYFGERGEGTEASSSLFDLSTIYRIAAWKSVTPWLKLEVRNLFNSKTQIASNRNVIPDLAGPVDQYGVWTDYIPSPVFGQALSISDFVEPREFRMSIGVRF